MNRVSPQNVFIPKDKGKSDPEFPATFGIFYPVSGSLFHISNCTPSPALDKATDFNFSAKCKFSS